MPTRHEVTQKECMLGIASRHGFSDWASIDDHPDNAALQDTPFFDGTEEQYQECRDVYRNGFWLPPDRVPGRDGWITVGSTTE